MKLKNVLFSMLCIVIFALTACSGNRIEKEDTSGKLKVVTTYSILYDMVKQVCGDKVDVHSIAPIGADPHEYDPLPKDSMKMAEANVVFYNGLNLEKGNSWFEKLLKSADKSGENAPVYKVRKE